MPFTVDAALAGYDTLSASQVVRRLESLGPDELRAVCRHEASHRNRRTILNRAQQLLEAAEPDRPGGWGAGEPPWKRRGPLQTTTCRPVSSCWPGH